MKNNEISLDRFAYRTTGTLSSILGGAAIGAIYGNPWGAIGGVVIGGASWAGEQGYDAYMWWNTQMSIGLTNIENGLSKGWIIR